MAASSLHHEPFLPRAHHDGGSFVCLLLRELSSSEWVWGKDILVQNFFIFPLLQYKLKHSWTTIFASSVFLGVSILFLFKGEKMELHQPGWAGFSALQKQIHAKSVCAMNLGKQNQMFIPLKALTWILLVGNAGTSKCYRS
ncbi:hypothetical protein MUK42_36743 [Musa troglodytarum]|uniref:Uncharacterized protein n=1 Tax=Musa troglodytarum TaxID=320322 RepID=A0A9E7G7F6_9LILI|nr:hypothetical protein MUK42_36743 [Musa troglodytarum]